MQRFLYQYCKLERCLLKSGPRCAAHVQGHCMTQHRRQQHTALCVVHPAGGGCRRPGGSAEAWGRAVLRGAGRELFLRRAEDSGCCAQGGQHPSAVPTWPGPPRKEPTVISQLLKLTLFNCFCKPCFFSRRKDDSLRACLFKDRAGNSWTLTQDCRAFL